LLDLEKIEFLLFKFELLDLRRLLVSLTDDSLNELLSVKGRLFLKGYFTFAENL
jgi:hypothetical protein